MKTAIRFEMAVGLILVIVGVGLVSFPAHAAESASSRDVSVDQALLGDGGMQGVLPPTGQAGVAGMLPNPLSAVFADPSLGRIAATPEIIAASKQDKQAKIYEVQGRAKIAREGSDDWQKLRAGSYIQEGDIVLTSEGARVQIAFDESFLNIVTVPGNTRAVFRAIEPTDIFLEDGTLYNVFDGLGKNANWKVTTPTAVAAVRGTTYFVNYTASNGEFVAAAVDVPDEGEDPSSIAVYLEGEEGSAVSVPEGFQIDLDFGQSPDESLLAVIDPFWLDQIQDILEDVAQKRQENNSEPPAGNGEFFQNDLGGGTGAGLDPQLDTGAVVTDEEEDPEPDPVVPNDAPPEE
ncbi:MAG: FecR domain-containing protein [Candidatus Omnitrophota bacterium]|nr:FecR domain-containing protein [Candidatus Omnitrophota bacterium]